MTTCTTCKGANVIRLNPLEKCPQYKCLSCKTVFIEQKDRIKLLIALNLEKPELRDIDRKGIINERCFEFWARTNPTFAKYYRQMLEETPNLAELLTPATTIDRDARRSFADNDEGLNATFKADNQRLEKAYLAE